MKSRDLIEALLAVLGVYLLVEGIALTVSFIAFGADGLNEFWPWSSSVVGAAVPLVLGTLVLAARARLADRLAPVSEPATAGNTDNLLEALLAVAGVCFVVSALATGAEVAAGGYLRADVIAKLSGQAPRLDEEWPPRFRVLVQLILGIWLAVGSRGIAAALAAFRAGGRRGTAA